MACFIGLMSGTSLDGVDGVLVHDTADGRAPVRAAAHVSLPMPEALRGELLALNRAGANELHRAALAANAISGLYADAVAQLLGQAGVAAADVAAVGAHGQTVRHRPQEFDGTGYTLQLVNGALLAELTGIDVVCDFRSRDLAAGGQGAPLVTAFHAACFAQPGTAVAVLNVGGIANLTLLSASGEAQGFDCGPGNMLMDLWCRQHRGTAFDAGGAWAAGGTVDALLLDRLLAEPFFGRAPPKSTGRDLFDAAWLDARLTRVATSAQDVMATLTELTARAAIDALRRHAPQTRSLLVCGGGAYNGHLMSRLARWMPPGSTVRSSADIGLPPEQVEALAFAWLARAHRDRTSGNLPAVTGARGPRVLGAL
ncbi:MAG: anhydro-N-acetylmuramic acid kinase, partial [Rubrivivax sp.]|nr:anhydro-N-acetylmuramic acid kinase [Rubrivivax sp.]